MGNNMALVLLILVSALSLLPPPATLAVTSPYVRPAPRETLSLLQDDDGDGQTPQQVTHWAWLSMRA